jgi:pimeloyl-ACP methyl ester carboxylesterase
MQEKIYFNDVLGYRIVAILSRPAKAMVSGKNPIAILCHGLNSSKDANTNIALEKIFLENKIDVFRFDFFAHGESEGDVADRNVTVFVDNILQSIEYVKNLGYKDIGLYGASFGGMAAVIAASKSKDVKVLALKAAGMGPSRDMPQYKKDFDSKTWITAAQKIAIPSLIIHGTADELIEPDYAKELADSIQSSNLLLYEGADHRFTNEKDFERVIRDVSKFIISALQKKL